jgi:hypothetical protein
MDWDKIVGSLADDVEFEIGGEKVKGADLKGYFNNQRTTLAQREQALQAAQNDLTAAKKFQEETSALFAAAARMPVDQGGGDQDRRPPVLTDEFSTYENDPLLGDFAKKFKGRLSKEMREEIIGELKPTLEAIRNETGQVTRFALIDRNQRDFKEAGEWPDGWDYRKAQDYAKEHNYWLPNGGDKYGLADVRRIHTEVTEPIRRSRFEEETRKNAREEAVKALRAEGATISMPNRTMGGGGKPVQVKGRNGEEILSNALRQAEQDLDTVRMLEGMRSN